MISHCWMDVIVLNLKQLSVLGVEKMVLIKCHVPSQFSC